MPEQDQSSTSGFQEWKSNVAQRFTNKLITPKAALKVGIVEMEFVEMSKNLMLISKPRLISPHIHDPVIFPESIQLNNSNTDLVLTEDQQFTSYQTDQAPTQPIADKKDASFDLAETIESKQSTPKST